MAFPMEPMVSESKDMTVKPRSKGNINPPTLKSAVIVGQTKVSGRPLSSLFSSKVFITSTRGLTSSFDTPVLMPNPKFGFGKMLPIHEFAHTFCCIWEFGIASTRESVKPLRPLIVVV